MTFCLLGLGANQGDRVGNLMAALDALRQEKRICVERVSSCWETAPVGGPPGQANYFNAAATIRTELSASELIATLLAIEKTLGRVRTECWGPRPIDLDLLLYGDAIIDTPGLKVPHPRLHERHFVLGPAAEIAADWLHPLRRQTIGQLLAALPDSTSSAAIMRVLTSPADMQAEVLKLRRAGQRVGLVPTMGALHAGHLSLVEMAHRHSDVVIATIFVNPTQFGPREDYSRYPRTLDQDLSALSAADCNLVLVPTADDIYPPGFSTYVQPPAVAEPLEGLCRPGHFRGVATVVLKLFHLVPVDVACFGLKDFQQQLVIRRMVQDLGLPIEIIPCPIIREPDGLAMSSRNRYLSSAERQQALSISRALNMSHEMVMAGERDAAVIAGKMRDTMTSAGIERIDYVALADPETLADVAILRGPAVALIAAYVGSTRLIDNRFLNSDSGP